MTTEKFNNRVINFPLRALLLYNAIFNICLALLPRFILLAASVSLLGTLLNIQQDRLQCEVKLSPHKAAI